MFAIRRLSITKSTIKEVGLLFNNFVPNMKINYLRYMSGSKKAVEDGFVTLSSRTYQPANHNISNEESPIIILHGLLGSKSNWHSVAHRLQHLLGNRRIITVDARNHGESPWAEEFNYEIMVGDLVRFLNDQSLEKASFIGHSMGGRTCMLLAMLFPTMVKNMVIVDISPTRSSPNMQIIPKLLKTISKLNLDPNYIASEARKQAEVQLQELKVDPALVKFIASNITTNEDYPETGNWRWKFNIKSILANFEKEMVRMPHLKPGAFKGRVLFVAGKNSDYILPEDEEDIRAVFNESLFKYIPDAGHWVHAEKPEKFIESVTKFFQSN